MVTPPISAADQAIYLEVAKNIVRDGRLRSRMTQAQLGRTVKLSQGEISRIETGAVDPPAWLIMYFIHIYPDLRERTQPDAKQLRRAVHQCIDEMDEAALRIVLALLGWSRTENKR